MPAERDASATDWVVLAISPVLIMLMVGSLVFFLVDVLYQGDYSERLLNTMAFFVIAAVLIARIAIERGYAYAALYGLGLGAATLFALSAFVTYPSGSIQVFAPFINIALMGLVWWSANKLTWDCTHVDEDRRTSGRGVLAAAGLDESAKPEEPEPVAEPTPKKKPKPDEAGIFGWVQRWQRHKAAERTKPHTPGVWVVYFSLAALPLFGLGQSLVDPSDTIRRRATFHEIVVYVGSGLGLLVTTTLLGLRKYLRERGAKVPHAMTAAWLGSGAVVIVIFLVVAAVLPRPHSETPLFRLPGGETSERSASRNVVVRDKSAGKGEGAEGRKTEPGDGDKTADGGKKGGKGDGEGKGSGDKDRDKGQGNGEQKGDSGGDKAGDKSAGESQEKLAPREQPKSDKQESSKSSSESSSTLPSQALEKVGAFVKWIVWIAVALLVGGGLILFFVKFLAPFTAWARGLLDWWNKLFAKKPKASPMDEPGDPQVAAVQRPPPFNAFANPFADGSARRMTTTELLEYTFAAFDAWAWDRDRGRANGETPNEFAARIGDDFPNLGEAGRGLAMAYVSALYSNAPPPPESAGAAKAFWKRVGEADAVGSK